MSSCLIYFLSKTGMEKITREHIILPTQTQRNKCLIRLGICLNLLQLEVLE
nr:MAG TPA: hypothetical protein [Crassvirales sp.]